MSGTAAKRPVPEAVGHILKARGLTVPEIQLFLYPDYERDLGDPFLLADMDVAIVRIEQAITGQQQIVVYGDYDIDGITASAVLLEGLTAAGGVARSYIPDRYEEGYGLNQEALEQLQSEGAQLVISVDCGITSVAEAAWAGAHGLDLIITDHHAVPEVLPQALAVINPRRPDDKYPFQDLAGVGVAFKLVQALQRRTGHPAAGQEKWLLDLVALGTVCDVVNLVGENRVLVKFGLQVLRRSRRVGLQALAAVSGVALDEIGTYHLGFIFGPRLNAAGRLEHAGQSLELLTTPDRARAAKIAATLDQLNRRRQSEQAAIILQAETMVEAFSDDPVLVLAHTDWSHGIVGIVASKLAEKYHKPALVLQVMGEQAKGSARSNGNFNMVDGLRAVSQHLEKFGGHFFAAGCTLPTANIEAVRQGLNDYFRQGKFAAAEESRFVDLEVTAPLVDWPLYRDLALLEPYGAGNREPVLALSELTIREVRRVGKDGKHLKLTVEAGVSQFGAIGFGLAEMYAQLRPGAVVEARFRLQENRFGGSVNLQLQLLTLNLP